MSRYLFIGLIIAAATIGGCKKAKLKWSQAEKIESYTDSRLNKILFSNSGKGFIAGGKRFEAANILTSNDNGSSWNLGNYPEAGKALYGIAQSSTGRLAVTGFDGKLLISDDDGDNWTLQQLSPWYSYKDLVLFSDNSGIVIGGNSFNSGIILRVDATGVVTNYDSMSIEFNKIVMTDEMTGYITGYGVVMKTTDGGNTWSYLDIRNDNFTGIHIIGNEIWVCGIAGSIFHSTDSGNSWDKLRNGNSVTNGNFTLKDIYFADNMLGWAVGEKGLVIQTTDGGNSWTRYETFTKKALHDICPTPDGHLMVAGDDGTLYKLHR